MTFRMKLATAAVAAALASTGALAQMNGRTPAAQAINNPDQNGMGAMANASTTANVDAAFLKRASQANMAEVSAAKLALSKSSNDEVKQFAQKMIDDHTAMQQQVEQVAGSVNVSLPQEPNKAQRMQAEKLEGLSGSVFDKAYIADQVKDHRKVLAEMKQENAATKNPQVKDLTTQGSQKVQQHLDMAEKIQSQIG